MDDKCDIKSNKEKGFITTVIETFSKSIYHRIFTLFRN